MISTAGALLAALEPLPHSARLRLTAVTAHRLAADGGLRPLLGELDALGPYERRLGALAAFAAGDLEHATARLGDLDPVVRRYALRAVRRLPAQGNAAVDAAIEAAYDDAPAVVRADLARLLRDGRRAPRAERLVGRVRTEYGDRDAALLLPGCSPEFTARLLPELAGALESEDWSTLALRHPVAVLDQAERQLAGLTGRFRGEWWRRYAAGPAAAVSAAPERVLELLETYGPEELPGPVHDRLGDLVAVDAERVVRRLADPERRHARWERTAGPALIRRLVAADPPSLHRLGLRWFHRGAFTLLLRTVPPERRGAFLDAVVAAAGPQDHNVRVHPGVLALLPPAERHARARAALDDAEGSWDRWSLLALLPPDEARPKLLAALASKDPEQRGGVWDMLVHNAVLGGDPEQVGELLARAAGRLAHEWDPVRRDLLSALADVPTPLLVTARDRADGSAPLERLCRDALAARDCSPMTRDAVRTLAVALLSDRTTGAALPLGARLLEQLTAHTGTVELGSLETVLDDDGVRAVTAALGPWLDRGAARGDVGPLLALVASCGRRAHGVPELQDRLEKALAACPDPVLGDVAAAWLADPATRGRRVAELLAREPSAASFPRCSPSSPRSDPICWTPPWRRPYAPAGGSRWRVLPGRCPPSGTPTGGCPGSRRPPSDWRRPSSPTRTGGPTNGPRSSARWRRCPSTAAPCCGGTPPPYRTPPGPSGRSPRRPWTRPRTRTIRPRPSAPSSTTPATTGPRRPGPPPRAPPRMPGPAGSRPCSTTSSRGRPG
ncbi:hypothetical protein [Streptomyces sp. NPDC058955]|uniref:hypothetical protein n=1 Tax=unclassified Streptomyces TaxID=2593676 RepID=UPI00364C63BB